MSGLIHRDARYIPSNNLLPRNWTTIIFGESTVHYPNGDESNFNRSHYEDVLIAKVHPNRIINKLPNITKQKTLILTSGNTVTDKLMISNAIWQKTEQSLSNSSSTFQRRTEKDFWKDWTMNRKLEVFLCRYQRTTILESLWKLIRMY